MLKSRNHIRLDKIEGQLTPKELAIRLVDEIRRYPSELEFLRAIAKGTYRESPYVKPFFVLTAQAEDRHPGQRPEDLRAKQRLSNDLRWEYQALKNLINDVNEELKIKTELSRLKGSMLANQLYQLILQDACGQTSEAAATWIKRHEATDAEEAERQLILGELGNVARAAGSRALIFSLARDWADDVAVLLTEVFVRKAAVQGVEKKYFDGHSMLSLSAEHAAETTIKLVLEAVATFNDYVSSRANGFSQDLRQRAESQDEAQPAVTSAEESLPWSSLRFDVEAIRIRGTELAPQAIISAWETEAQHKAIVDILQETGEHGSVVWQRFCDEVGTKPLAQ